MKGNPYPAVEQFNLAALERECPARVAEREFLEGHAEERQREIDRQIQNVAGCAVQLNGTAFRASSKQIEWGRPRHDPPRNSQGIHPERTFKMNAGAVSQEYQGEEDGKDN